MVLKDALEGNVARDEGGASEGSWRWYSCCWASMARVYIMTPFHSCMCAIPASFP